MTARLDIIQCLRRLDELDTVRSALKPKSTKSAGLGDEIEAIRRHLPTAILNHYDQRRSHKRPAIAPVRHGICGGCQVPMSRSGLANLHRSGGAVHVCENCGVFIYLDDSGTNGPGVSSAQ